MSTAKPVSTPKDLVPLAGFYAILWVGVATCTLMFAGRIYVRFMCFRRLLVDDYMMALSWATLVAMAALGQAYLEDVYMLMAFLNHRRLPPATFVPASENGLRAFGVVILLAYVGIYAVKLNFLLFFKSLVGPIRAYVIFWWIVVAITIACGITSIAFVHYRCLFRGISYAVQYCSQVSTIRQTYSFFKVSCIVDVISDVLIIVFPITILWKVRITPRRKLILYGIFALVSFTIAVTIVRGSVFGGTYKSIDENNPQQLNVTWIWLWFYIEQSVSLIIACLVSFRALFVHCEKKVDSYEARLRAQIAYRTPYTSSGKGSGSGITSKVIHFHDSVLDSFKASETTDHGPLTLPAFNRLTPTFIINVKGSESDATEEREHPSDTAVAK